MTLFGLQWASPLALYLLPLLVLPWFTRTQDKTIVWSKFVPVDPLSNIIGFAFKTLASIVLACLILSLAGPYLPEKKVDRIGEGAEVVVLVDRSRSMDDAFAIKGQLLMASVGKSDSKRRVAKKYLQEFIDKRPDDRFGFVLFSDKALDLLPLTYNKETIRATVDASALGKGLSETNIAKALIKAAEMYQGQTYRGSRIVVLVSDGGQEFTEEAKQKIAELYKQQNLTLYWLYMRSVTGMTLDAKPGDNERWTTTPERKLHTFFKSIGIPYLPFEIGSMKSFSEAIATIDKQQYQTLIVEETLPREDKAKVFLIIAMLAMFLLMLAQMYTAWGVRKAHQ
ncbi:MAG: VWA domain-containing protein [Pseudomonadota bacterium]|nr:VWA domain-containing protein [Pseudomonadota bacterium]MDO7667258.1 VWA domain-containing protein [Pseudomonadota bacterium]MDO7710145.1 VWA domain-containing protein [Pseudomonadota bacterium]